jgi:hypothetical protein
MTTFTGANRLVLNQATLVQAVQYYLDCEVFAEKDVKVVSFSHDVSTGMTTFSLSEPEKK